jgi:putative transposase
MRAVVHRPLEGTPKRCTLKRDGDQWFVSFTCKVKIDNLTPPSGPPVGIDRGIIALVADSMGHVESNPNFTKKSAKRVARAQREVARRKKGSKNHEKSKAKVARLCRKIRRQRDHTQHILTTNYSKNHGLIVVEDLHIDNMVSANRGLARSIYDAAWGRFDQMLQYKTLWHGSRYLKVPAAYSSQMCAVCGHVDALSRVSQNLFVCTNCGHAAHADVNAAKVILQRGLRAVESTATVCGGSGTGRPAKQKLYVVRRGHDQ